MKIRDSTVYLNTSRCKKAIIYNDNTIKMNAVLKNIKIRYGIQVTIQMREIELDVKYAIIKCMYS